MNVPGSKLRKILLQRQGNGDDTQGTTRRRGKSYELDRRSVVKSIGFGIAGVSVIGTGEAVAQDTDAKLVFNAQQSDGETVVIAEIFVEIERRLHVFDTDRNLLNEPERIPPGETVEDYEVKLTNPISETQELVASLVGGDEDIKDRALVTIGETPSNNTETPTSTPEDTETPDSNSETSQDTDSNPENSGTSDSRLIEASPDQGFNYPYFLHTPAGIGDDATPILVQPNNSGTTTDEFQAQLHSVEHRLEQGGFIRRIARRLGAPLLIPVFPRPENDPVNWEHYTHSLDVDTMEISGGPLERIDLQLLQMVEDARSRLSEQKIQTMDGIILNGFSAAGNFVNRFAALHPEQVISVTAGGINGTAILPIENARGHTLNYHIGVANLEELTDSPFNLNAFQTTNQFLYMGELDTNDTIPFDDAWSDEQRQIAVEVYGDDMQEERMPFCKAIYDREDISSVFRIYEDVGHSPHEALNDVVEFHRRSIAAEDIQSIRSDLGGNVPNLNAYIRYQPRNPIVGEQVAFDASLSSVWNRTLTDFVWTFNSDQTKTGVQVNHTFDHPGGHNVKLTITDEEGDSYEAPVQITVESDRSINIGNISFDTLDGVYAGLGALVGLIVGSRRKKRSDD